MVFWNSKQHVTTTSTCALSKPAKETTVNLLPMTAATAEATVLDVLCDYYFKLQVSHIHDFETTMVLITTVPLSDTTWAAIIYSRAQTHHTHASVHSESDLPSLSHNHTEMDFFNKIKSLQLR